MKRLPVLITVFTSLGAVLMISSCRLGPEDCHCHGLINNPVVMGCVGCLCSDLAPNYANESIKSEDYYISDTAVNVYKDSSFFGKQKLSVRGEIKFNVDAYNIKIDVNVLCENSVITTMSTTADRCAKGQTLFFSWKDLTPDIYYNTGKLSVLVEVSGMKEA